MTRDNGVRFNERWPAVVAGFVLTFPGSLEPNVARPTRLHPVSAWQRMTLFKEPSCGILTIPWPRPCSAGIDFGKRLIHRQILPGQAVFSVTDDGTVVLARSHYKPTRIVVFHGRKARKARCGSLSFVIVPASTRSGSERPGEGSFPAPRIFWSQLLIGGQSDAGCQSVSCVSHSGVSRTQRRLVHKTCRACALRNSPSSTLPVQFQKH